MTCDEGRLVAFLDGQLSEADEAAFDEHLLTCEACWGAVRADREGREALDRLRLAAPPGLADRVTAAIRLADTPAQDRDPHTAGDPHVASGRHLLQAARHRPRRLVAVAAATVALVGGIGGWALSDRHGAGDPPQISRVAAMMTPGVEHERALQAGEQFDFGGQTLVVRSYQVEGDTVLVATSARPFPMPASSHITAGSSTTAWMAAEGDLGMYGVNQPAGSKQSSMFLVAAMPMAQLPQVAALLHLI